SSFLASGSHRKNGVGPPRRFGPSKPHLLAIRAPGQAFDARVCRKYRVAPIHIHQIDRSVVVPEDRVIFKRDPAAVRRKTRMTNPTPALLKQHMPCRKFKPRA